MFHTISFSEKKNTTKNSKASTFSLARANQSTRKFACESCRIHKVKCSGEQSGCARCVESKIKCRYDRIGTSSSRSSRSQSYNKMNSTLGMELSWSIHNPNKDQSPKRQHNNPARFMPLEERSQVLPTTDPIDKTQNGIGLANISPECGEEHISLQGLTPASNGDGELMNTPGNTENLLDWTFETDNPSNCTTNLIAYDSNVGNEVQQFPDLAPESDVSLAHELQASDTSSLITFCDCFVRLSTLLFILSGYSRQYSHSLSLSSPCDDGLQLGESLSFIFAAHERAIQLENDLVICGSQCFLQGPNTIQLIMVIEQLVDLYSGLVQDLPRASSEGNEQIAAGIEAMVPVRVGAYVVESAAERRSLVTLLVSKRLKSITEFAVRFRDRLWNVSGHGGQCRGRLHAAVQRLELLGNS